MSEFEKELEKNIKLNKVVYEKESPYNYFLVSKRDIERIFKDWQPPKPQQSLPVVPEDIDKAIKYLKTQNSFATITDLQKLDILTEKGFWWLNDFQIKDRRFGFGGLNNKLFILSHLAITGYTVEKEKKYILKHIDMSKFSKGDSLYLSRSIKEEVFGKYDHMRVPDGVNVSEIEQCHFTQEEIDKLNIGSYEQIPVEMSDNGI